MKSLLIISIGKKIGKIKTVWKEILGKVIVFFKYLTGRIICSFFSFLPIQRKVVFSNFSGKCYGDNPRYISEALHEKCPDVDIVWLKHKGYSFEIPDYVRVVRWPSLDMFYEHVTAKVWVDSHIKPLYLHKRKDQYFIETWHGGLGIKKIEGDIDDKIPWANKKYAQHCFQSADLMISNSTFLSNIYRRAFHYEGGIIECGYPKNDIFYQKNDTLAGKIREKLSLSQTTKLLLYAPTFRGLDGKEELDWLILDYERICNALQERFREPWVILVKLHPLFLGWDQELVKESYMVRNVTDYPDMQELLLACDICVTDYSSCIFDFVLSGKPGFLYAPDYERYSRERGMYFDIRRDLPFSFADDEDSLLRNIFDFDPDVYRRRLRDFWESPEIGLKETGYAADYVAGLIVKKLNKCE